MRQKIIRKNDLRPASSQGDRSQGQGQQCQSGGFGHCAARHEQGAATVVCFPIGKRTDTRVALLEEEVGPIDEEVGVEVARGKRHHPRQAESKIAAIGLGNETIKAEVDARAGGVSGAPPNAT